jgi:hypothetical protein
MGAVNETHRLGAVLRLHSPVMMDSLAYECHEAICDGHGGENCPVELVKVCRHCYDLGHGVDEDTPIADGSLYPCATMKLLTEES